MVYKSETKREVRMRHRKELEQQGITIGCHHVISAKAKLGDMRQGKCLVCGYDTKGCTCDDRDEWTKRRTE